MTRANAVRALALAATLALWIPARGLIDLIAPWFRDEPTIVQDIGYGAITGILAPAGLLAQVRRPGTGIAGLQQISLCVVAYAVAGAIADSGYFLLAAALGTVLVTLLVLHPVGGLFLAVPDEVSRRRGRGGAHGPGLRHRPRRAARGPPNDRLARACLERGGRGRRLGRSVHVAP